MAGAGLVAIKKRIKSVTNTRKITNAMGLVATSKLKKVRGKLITNNKFQDKLDEIFENIIRNDFFAERNIYTYGNGSNKKLYIVLTSDFGLCGGFNANVLKQTLDEINKDKENSSLIIVGQKGKLFTNRFKVDVLAEFLDINDIPTIKEARDIASEAIENYREKEFGEVYIVFTEFVSPIKKEVKVKKLLPFENHRKYSPDTFYEDTMEVEPKLRTVADSIIEMYLKDVILNCLYNSKASEQSIRMASMDSATKNANELLDKLKLKFNRVRQSVITQEISEIVSGAEAQH